MSGEGTYRKRFNPEGEGPVLANLRQDWPPYDAREHAAAALEALEEKS